MTIAVVRFPGSNCDDDARHAFEFVLGAPVRYVWHRDTALGRVDAVVLPGGFSYGDYLRGGALAALSPVMEAVRRFAERGGPVLGICNGWQILTEARLLPGQLARNPSLHFKCQDVHLRVERDDLLFTRHYRKGQVLRVPIAHNEGRFYADAETLTRIEDGGRVAFRYVDAGGLETVEANANGSAHAIAGVVNERGNVLGMMPHPERAVEALLGSTDGAPLLRGVLDHLAGSRPSA
ncbi:MAG TPA: phosphoribosylformylglycinamidine synthase subunit PurQ [Trueperaceae bacterium]|nr:phosphoribosylformylglycinamidine synthase subunit PurQ [Trueperaceae bacterium]